MRISDWSSDVCSSDLDKNDRPEDQADDDRRHYRPDGDPHACGAERPFDGASEPFGLAAFLGEGLDDLHRAKRLGDERAQIGDPVLTRARKGPDPPAKQHDGTDDERNAQKRSEEHTSELQSLMRIS